MTQLNRFSAEAEDSGIQIKGKIAEADFIDNDTAGSSCKRAYPCQKLITVKDVYQLRRVVERVHDYGSKLGIQLSPGIGRMNYLRVLE